MKLSMSDEALSPIEEHFVEWAQQLQKGENSFAQPQEKLDEMYAQAYALYEARRYHDAGLFFRLLVAADPTESNYWKSLGACLQMQKNYEEALNCYSCVEMMLGDSTNPYLYIHAADCYFALKQGHHGLRMLERACKKAEKTHDKKIFQHAALLREIWSKK